MAQEDHPLVLRNRSLLAEYSKYIILVNAHSNPAGGNASRCKTTFLPSLFWCSALGKIYSFPGEQGMPPGAVNTWQTTWGSCSSSKASGRRVLWLRCRSDVQWNLFFVTFAARKVDAAVTESLITLDARWHVYVLVRRVPRSPWNPIQTTWRMCFLTSVIRRICSVHKYTQFCHVWSLPPDVLCFLPLLIQDTCWENVFLFAAARKAGKGIHFCVTFRGQGDRICQRKCLPCG